PLDSMAALRRFRTLVDQSVDVIMLVGPTGELLYASLVASSVLGYAPGESLGRATFELVHPDDLAQVHALFRDLVTRSTGPTRAEFRVRHKDGSWRYLEATGINRLDEPAVEAIVVTCRDVTDRRQAEESLRATQSLLQSVLDNAPIVLLAVNKEGIQQAQQEAWSRKLIEAQEAERRAVARELHDDFGQVLTALKLNLQRRDRDDAETIALVDSAIARMRELAQDLRSMQERVTLADGDLHIDSTPSRGTAVRARLPLTARGDA